MFDQPEMIVYADGSREWHLDGHLHREDGPAVEWSGGAKEWFLNGKRHRSDGPAYEGADGSKVWWFDGNEISWQDLYRQAKDPEIELKILSAALTIP
jgi:hypothetical protein